MRYFPAYVDLAASRAVIVGGGEQAIQKLRLLAKTEAAITVVASEPAAELRTLALQTGAQVVEAGFEPAHLDGARLVFAADDCVLIDLAVAAAARQRGIAVNVVDRPGESTFIVPAIVDRDPVIVAIGTEGTAPILAREVKSKVEALLPQRFGDLARKAGALRGRMHAAVRDPAVRRKVWERVLRGGWRRSVLSDRLNEQEADAEFARAVQAGQKGELCIGRVSLVGAGPGDADLLTLKAQQRLQEADVLVIDALVTPDVLEYARRDAERIDVGKKGYGIATDQAEINRILIREAAKGRNVVRIKGGDPFVFARAAEEMTALRAAGIPVDVVPGITSAHACAASIGLPLTLRETIRQFSIVTGATRNGVPDLDWQGLARPGHAFAIYMGLKSAPVVRRNLLDASADPALPVVIVENGTRADERVILTTLDRFSDAIAAKGIVGPTIVFVGLSWQAAHLTPPAHLETYDAEEAVGQPVDAGTGKGELAAGAAVVDLGHGLTTDDWSPQRIAAATMWVAG